MSVSAPSSQLLTRSHHTREALLDAAERLFMTQGHYDTSLRQITAEAQANLAAVSYHFGSKEALIQAVLKRRLSVINIERLKALDVLEAQADGAPLKASQILEAFFGTLLRIATAPGQDARGLLLLLERTITDPAAFIHAVFAQEYAPVIDRFRHALFKALPGVPQDEIIWRFQFMLGATSYAIVGPTALLRAAGVPQADDRQDDMSLLIPRLMSFLLGGLRAPLPDSLPPAPAEAAEASKRSPPTPHHTGDRT